MTTKTDHKSKLELPFQLETALEQTIAVDPEWIAGLAWGQPRSGHPEGQVKFHIRDVLQNIDQFFGSDVYRSRLRLIALIHDTFKYQAATWQKRGHRHHHGYLARKFAARYINDEGTLQVIEWHDDAYKAWVLWAQHGDRQAAEKQAASLIARLEGNLGLFIRFYLCDSRITGKSTRHYTWFKEFVEKEVLS